MIGVCVHKYMHLCAQTHTHTYMSKKKMSKMESVWDGGVWMKKRRAELEIGRTRGKERWRVRLIYVACVRDNRKARGYSWGLREAMRQKQRERDRVRDYWRKRGEKAKRGNVSLLANLREWCLFLDTGHQGTVTAVGSTLIVWLYNARSNKYFHRWMSITMDNMRTLQNISVPPSGNIRRLIPHLNVKCTSNK